MIFWLIWYLLFILSLFCFIKSLYFVTIGKIYLFFFCHCYTELLTIVIVIGNYWKLLFRKLWSETETLIYFPSYFRENTVRPLHSSLWALTARTAPLCSSDSCLLLASFVLSTPAAEVGLETDCWFRWIEGVIQDGAQPKRASAHNLKECSQLVCGWQVPSVISFFLSRKRARPTGISSAATAQLDQGLRSTINRRLAIVNLRHRHQLIPLGASQRPLD